MVTDTNWPDIQPYSVFGRISGKSNQVSCMDRMLCHMLESKTPASHLMPPQMLRWWKIPASHNIHSRILVSSTPDSHHMYPRRI
jgi:hypothetical protein